VIEELKGPDGQRIAISMIGAAVAFLVIFYGVYAILGKDRHDLAMLLGSLLATYGGVAVPYFVVKYLAAGEEKAPASKASHA
jgi:hypothetical protein